MGTGVFKETDGVRKEMTASEVSQLNSEGKAFLSENFRIVSTRMVDVWLRTTETEAAQLRQAIDTSDPRTTGIINATMRFDQSGEPFALLKGIADDIWSAARVSVILAPSET